MVKRIVMLMQAVNMNTLLEETLVPVCKLGKSLLIIWHLPWKRHKNFGQYFSSMEPTMASDEKIIDTVPTDFQASFLAEVEINTQHFSSNVPNWLWYKESTHCS